VRTASIISAIHHPDDGGSTHLWNVGQHLLDYTAVHPRRLKTSWIWLFWSQVNCSYFTYECIFRPFSGVWAYFNHIYVKSLKFWGSLRRTAGYTKLDKKRNIEILRELKVNSVLEHTDQYRNNWEQHVQRMDRSRIPRQMMIYRPKGKRSLGRPLKRWRETITGHWDLIRVRRRKKCICSLYFGYLIHIIVKGRTEAEHKDRE
jgi:hypothetical protein